MPTGYTYAIADGINFDDFVMQCARGMGALILMRDEPSDAVIPERFEPSDHHALKIAEAVIALEWLNNMSVEDAEVAARQAYVEAIEQKEAGIRKNNELRAKYQSMLDMVLKWVPPTKDHEGLKKFMIEQITGSIEFDCDNSYYSNMSLTQKTGKQWRAEQIASAKRDLEYHTKEHNKELKRTEDRNRWLQELRESL